MYDTNQFSEAAMTGEVYTILKENALREKDWQYRLAQDLVDRDADLRIFSGFDNFQKLAHMLRDIMSFGATGPDLIAEAQLCAAYGDTFRAYTIFKSNKHLNLRYMIEALIIATAAPAEIADRVGQDEGVIKFFTEYFFDVVDRVGNKGFVQSSLLGSRLGSGIFSADIDVYWKTIAAFGGVEMLNAIWDGGTLTGQQTLDIKRALKQTLYRDTLKAFHVRRPAEHNASEILSDLVIVNKEIAPDSGGENELEVATKEIIDCVKPEQRDWDAPYDAYEQALYAKKQEEALDAPDGFVRED